MPGLLPLLFVAVWSTGFVVARIAILDADPQLFLVVRMLLVAVVMAAWAAAARDAWPRGRRAWLHVALGAAMPGFYLSGGWWAVGEGMPAGIMSLLGGLQPLAMALLAGLVLKEAVGGRGWAGLAIGTLGVALVLAPGLARGGAHGITPATAAIGIAAVLAMSAATMVQRARLAADALAPAVALQNLGGAAFAIAGMPFIGALRWHDGLRLWGTLAWSVLGLSALALTLLAWMLRHQGAARVSVLLLLVPPLAAIESWALFGERLSAIQLAGFALALAGVLIARAPPPTRAEPA